MPYDEKRQFRGAFQYFLNERDSAIAVRSSLRFGEVFPPLPTGKVREKQEREYSITTPASLEIWKEPGEMARLVVGTASEDFDALAKEFQSTYPGAQVQDIAETQPGWVKNARTLLGQGNAPHFFDFEQAHAFPFLLFDTSQPQTLVEKLILALNGRAGWIQIVWMPYDWTHEAEAASGLLQRLIIEIGKGVEITTGVTTGKFDWAVFPTGTKKEKAPHPAEGSFYHKNGERIAKEAIEKAHSHPLVVSVRGVILTKDGDLDLSGIFSSVRPSFDDIRPYFYENSLVLRWLKARDIPNPTRFIRNYASGGFLPDWGKGREMIPVFCVTPSELPLFVNLPQSLALAPYVNYVRDSGLPELAPPEKEGVVLGI